MKSSAKAWLGVLLFGFSLALGLLFFPTFPLKFFWAIGAAVWVIAWWIARPFPMGLTSLLPIVLLPLGNVLEIGDLGHTYANPVIFLFLGGFLLARGLEKWEIHRLICGLILKITGTQSWRLVLGFGISSFVLSMWISNTATAIMMLGLATPLLNHIPNGHEGRKHNTAAALLLAIAWGANIGGTATIIGTPPNAVLAGLHLQHYGEPLTFAFWISHIFPFSAVVFIMATALLLWYFSVTGIQDYALKAINPGKEKLKAAQKRMLWVFLSAALLWSLQPVLNHLLELASFSFKLNDAWIAMLCGISMFLIPAKKPDNDGGSLLNWPDMIHLRWEILLLFGAGLSIAKGLESAGVIGEVGQGLMALAHGNSFLLSSLFTAASLFLTEIMSNVALTSIMVPVSFGISDQMGLLALYPALSITLASSMAFMLPIATPPNAIVFASGKLHVGHMIKAGLLLNLICLAALLLLNWVMFGR